jgi:hypothetical protein
VSDTVMNDLPLRLSLGRDHGVRSITDQGERARDTVLSDVITGAYPGTQRKIVFRDCKLYGDVYGDVSRAMKLDGAIEDLLFTAYVWQTAGHRPPDERPWQIGMISPIGPGLDLYVSPGVFEHFWEAADAPEDERPVAALITHSDPQSVVLFVSQISLELRPRNHPVVREIELLKAIIAGAIRLGWSICAILGAILVIELIRWLWR